MRHGSGSSGTEASPPHHYLVGRQTCRSRMPRRNNAGTCHVRRAIEAGRANAPPPLRARSRDNNFRRSATRPRGEPRAGPAIMYSDLGSEGAVRLRRYCFNAPGCWRDRLSAPFAMISSKSPAPLRAWGAEAPSHKVNRKSCKRKQRAPEMLIVRIFFLVKAGRTHAPRRRSANLHPWSALGYTIQDAMQDFEEQPR